MEQENHNEKEKNQQKQFEQIKYEEIFINSVSLKFLKNINNLVKQQQISFIYNENQDIVKNVYEGGFKIWECTKDLLLFLDNNKSTISLIGKSVMDLGCGNGLLGIYSLKQNCQYILFQDFNKEVLEIATWNNIKANFQQSEYFPSILQKIIFLSGDWQDLNKKIEVKENNFKDISKETSQNQYYEKEFDVILMSEVIYNQENYNKVSQLIISFLKKEGVCFLANKLFYFGCGGSTPEFVDFVNSNYQNQLNCESSLFIDNKKGNKREILKITKK